MNSENEPASRPRSRLPQSRLLNLTVKRLGQYIALLALATGTLMALLLTIKILGNLGDFRSREEAALQRVADLLVGAGNGGSSAEERGLTGAAPAPVPATPPLSDVAATNLVLLCILAIFFLIFIVRMWFLQIVRRLAVARACRVRDFCTFLGCLWIWIWVILEIVVWTLLLLLSLVIVVLNIVALVSLAL